MKTMMYKTVMNAKSTHSALLQSLGFSKHFVRDHSPIHKLLTVAAFKLAVSMREEMAA